MRINCFLTKPFQGKDKSTFEDRVQKLLVEMFGEESVSYQPKLKYITVTVDNDKAVVNLKSYEGTHLTSYVIEILSAR